MKRWASIAVLLASTATATGQPPAAGGPSPRTAGPRAVPRSSDARPRVADPRLRPAPSPGADRERPLALEQASWTFVPTPPVRTVDINDIVTIRVDELARARAEGGAENRKNSLYDAILKDWLVVLGIDDVRPSPQTDGDQRVQGTLNELYRADSTIESRESITFNIAASVVDIRPNGLLVLEAHKTIWVNDNAFETSLSGICRAEDVGPDNTVLSRDLVDLQIKKQERGHLRDGYRRGWFKRWFDQFQPF